MHEHCRPDRNQFIRINASNIKQSKHGWLCYRVMQGRVAAMDVSCKSSTLGPVSRKPRKLFGPIKPFLIHLYLKKGEVHAPETSCMKRTSVQIKNFWIEQLCNRKVRDFFMSLRAWKDSGAFEKRAPDTKRPFHSRFVQWPGLWMPARLDVTSFCCVNQIILMLTSSHLNGKSSELCIKTMLPPASPANTSQVTEHTTIKWPSLGAALIPFRKLFHWDALNKISDVWHYVEVMAIVV